MTIRFFILTVVCVVIFLMTKPENTNAHDPITTKVTFNKEIAHILQRSCWGCHAPGNIKGDIPLTTYEEARPWAKAIKEEVLERRMPPYQPVKGYGLFKHDYLLPQRDIELIVSWVEGGAPRGNLNDYPKPRETWALGKPDLILQAQSEAEITKQDEVRCYSLPTNFTEDRWVSGFDFVAGNPAVVYRASYQLETAANKNTCDIDATSSELLGNWQPNQAPLHFPVNTARRLPAGSQIKLIVQYRQANEGDKTTDRSQLALYFSQEARPRTLRDLALKPRATVLPMSDKATRVTITHTLTSSTETVAIRPRLFPYGESLQATAHYPNGVSEVLLVAKEHRFPWQPFYVFRQPVTMPRGTRLEIVAYLKNTEDAPHVPHQSGKKNLFTEPLCDLLITASPAATLNKPTGLSAYR